MPRIPTLMPKDSSRLARNVLREVQKVIDSQSVVNGGNAVTVSGPGGPWKIKRYKNSRGYLHLNVTAPGLAQPLYSIQAIRDTLVEKYDLTIDQLDFQSPTKKDENGEEEEVKGEGKGEGEGKEEENPLSIRAIHRIQTAYRSHLLRVAWAKCMELKKKLENMQKRIAAAEDVARDVGTRFKISSKEEVSFTVMNPTLPPLIVRYPVMTVAIHSGSAPVLNLLTLMIHPTQLTRGDVQERTATIMKTYSNKTMIFKLSKAVTMAPHYPLLIGELPLPTIDTFQYNSGSSRVYVSCTSGGVSSHHAELLKTSFGPKWLKHVAHVMSLRPDMRAFDMYSDCHLTRYRCSFVVSKHLVRVRGQVHPTIHIVSIASSQRRCGNGNLMMNLCKTLLFSDGLSISTGIVFAQCLKIDFWEYRLHEDPRAQAMIFQMTMIYAEYLLESNCVMKMVEYQNEDDTVPSPAKILPE